MRLTDYLEDSIVIQGQEFKLDFSYDNILRVKELENAPYNTHKITSIMFDNLVIDCDLDLSIEAKKEVVEMVMHELLPTDNIEEQANEETENKEEVPKKKTHDLAKDADLIYASFLYDYNIDLFEQQGKLHWKKFIALLNNLSEDSVFKKVVHIRVKKIPKETKHNKEEIQNLRKLQRLYSLEQNEEDAIKELDSQMGSLAQSLKNSAKKGR